MPRLHSSFFVMLALSLGACSQSGAIAPVGAGSSAASANPDDSHRAVQSNATTVPTSTPSATPVHTATPTATPVKVPVATATPIVTLTPVPGSPTFYAAGDIADSVGVDTVLLAYPTMQPSDATQLGALVGAAHIRHYRASVASGVAYAQNILAFNAASKAKPLLETDCNPKVGLNGLTTSAKLLAFNASIGNSADSIEGVNEPDTRYSQDTNFKSDLDACQATVSAILPSLPYVAPAVAQPGRYQYVGFIPNMGVANIHRYFAGHNPGTVGYGPSHYCGFEYASLGYEKCYAAGEAGSNKPYYITETGWNTDSGEVDLTTQAKYSTREILYDYINGVARTYFYPFVAYTGADQVGGNGLLNTDRSPKPAYTAIKTLLQFLADDNRAAGFKATNRSFGVAGASSSVMVVPMEKSDGSTVVAIWNETLSYDSTNKVKIAVPAQSVTMSIPAGQAATGVRQISDSGTMTSTWFKWSGANIVFPIDDHVTLVTFK